MHRDRLYSQGTLQSPSNIYSLVMINTIFLQGHNQNFKLKINLPYIRYRYPCYLAFLINIFRLKAQISTHSTHHSVITIVINITITFYITMQWLEYTISLLCRYAPWFVWLPGLHSIILGSKNKSLQNV